MAKKTLKTVLIVDDEESVREIVSEMISEMGYNVQSAESGEAALDLISRIDFDLVISDVKMDGMDGLTLAQRLRKKFPKLPLALMTAHPSDGVYKMVQEKLVDFLLLKPFQIDELKGMVLNLTS